MSIPDIFSRRNNRTSEPVDVIESVSTKLHNQVVIILERAFSFVSSIRKDKTFRAIRNILREEYGVTSLPSNEALTIPDGLPWIELTDFMRDASTSHRYLDAVELLLVAIDQQSWVHTPTTNGIGGIRHEDMHSAITSINQRFREAGFPYQYESGQIIRAGSDLLHDNVTAPALSLLTAPGYEGANEEFLRAHHHFRGGNLKECITECGKALESTLKIICKIRGWESKKDTASSLIIVCKDKGLFPPFLQEQLSTLEVLLRSGVPTVRNNMGAHGQGSEKVEVPEYFAAYQLHVTASTLLLLMKCEIETRE